MSTADSVLRISKYIAIQFVLINGKKMKKVLLSLAGVVLILANTSVEAGTQLNFTTTIIQSCTLSMSSNPLTVNLGKYPTSFFSKSGTASPFKYFGIHISGCANSKISLRWSGNIANNYEYSLAVDGANGLGVMISDEIKNKLYSFTKAPGEEMFIDTDSSGNYDFKLAAFYYSYKDSVTAGSANASATVEVSYH